MISLVFSLHLSSRLLFHFLIHLSIHFACHVGKVRVDGSGHVEWIGRIDRWEEMKC